MTDSRPDTDSTPSKPRGLWSLMGAPATESAESDASVNETPPSADPAASPLSPNKPSDVAIDADQSPMTTAADGVPDTPSPRQRGLWGMMRGPGASPPQQDESPPPAGNSPSDSKNSIDSDPHGDDRGHRSPGSRSLFALMQSAAAEPGEAIDDSGDVPEEIEEDRKSHDEERVIYRRQSAVLVTSDDEEVDDDEIRSEDEPLLEEDSSLPETSGTSRPADSAGLSSLTMGAIDPVDLEPPRYRLAAAQSRKQGAMALGCGIAAVVASALSLLPNFLASLPATALGFISIISGYLALTGPGRRELGRAVRGICLLGMLLGTVGIFLGPLFVAGLGRNLREATGHVATRQHLQAIGQGLDQHYSKHEAFPIGGTFGRNDAGAIRGQHGWMTFLLPFVGETELYQQIELAKPYDDLLNRNPMGHNVSIYFAAGGDRSRIGEGFSVAHFAGVGGEIDDLNGLSHLGIFERDVAVKREEITDGLANTLIVGELAGTYPPWGDPENWRKIGKGLNKDVNGFGSYGGNGATFLLADGAVKFFSNKTDPGLLQRMSTRDGGE